MPVVSSQSPVISQKIRNAFSKAAARYDELATLQQVVGLRFLSQLESENPKDILDIGMGTGWFTENLLAGFPSAKVTGIDFASGMVEAAQKKEAKFSLAQADALNLPFHREAFDLIVSNLAYQWVEDLNGAFGQVYDALQPNGMFYLTAFGKNSLSELFSVLQGSRNGRKVSFSPRSLPSKEDFADALIKNGFDNIHVTSEKFKVYFTDVKALLRWLKDIGANTGGGEVFLGKDQLLRADEIYKRNFSDNNKIVATFEVVWAKAKK